MANNPTIPIVDTAELDVGTGRRRAQADARAFGALEARSLTAVSAGLDRVARVAAEKQDEFDEADAIEGDNELAERIRTRMYDPDGGYITTARGRAAQERRPEMEQALQDDLDELAARARSPRAAALRREVGSRRVRDTLETMATHIAAESRSHLVGQLEARVAEAQTAAVAAFGDQAVVARQVGTAISAVEELARMNGWSTEQTTMRVRGVQSGIYASVIQNLATVDPQAAEQLFAGLRSTLDAQTAGELGTTMRVAQREYIDRVEGAAWQAFAAGRPLTSLDPNVYAELTSNPLLGQSHSRLTEAYRTRAQSYANNGGRVRDNSPAYIGALLTATQDPDVFTTDGALEDYMARHADSLSGGDMARLIERRQRIRNGEEGAADIGSQRETFNAVRSVAASALRSHGFTLDLRENASERDRNRTAAFDAALMNAVTSFVTTERRQPNAEEAQILIGRAIVGMRDENLQGLPAFRVRGERGRDGVRQGSWWVGQSVGSRVRPTSEAVVPFDAIPPTARNELVTGLRSRLRRTPTRGEVENAYAAYLQDVSIEHVTVQESPFAPPLWGYDRYPEVEIVDE